MSKLVETFEVADFDLGDRVTFLHDGERLVGEVVRVYNTRDLFHVEVNGRRYQVDPCDDDMQRAPVSS